MALTIDGQIDVATSNEYIYATVSGFVVAAVSGEPVKISGESVSISGQGVLISGQLTTYSGIGVAVQSGYGVLTNISGQAVSVNISGQLTTFSGIGITAQSGYGVIVQSGYGVITSVSGNIIKAVNLSGNDLSITANVSGQIVGVVISGQSIAVSGTVGLVSGAWVSTSISGQPVLISGQWTTYSGIGVTVQSGYGVLANISGQSVRTTISGEPIWEHDLYPVWTGRKYRVDAWNNSITKPNTLEILVKTSSRVVHAEYRFLTGGEGSLVFYENPTVTSNGLLFSYINMNRASNEVPVTTVYTGGRHTSGTGIRLALDYLAVPQPSFAGFAPKEEFILNTSGTYLLVFNAVGTNLPIGLTMYYWEDV